MQPLATQIEAEATYLGDNIIKIDSLVNHRIDPRLMTPAGDSFVASLGAKGVSGVTKVLTAETSGIIPAYVTAQAYGVPVVFARKRKPVTMRDAWVAEALSRTGQGQVSLMVSKEYLGADDRVVIIDDFLGTGRTLLALTELVRSAGAVLCGIGCLIEKGFETHDPGLYALGVPVVSLVRVDLAGDTVRATALA